MWGPDIPPPGVTPKRALNHFLIAASVFVGFFFTTKHFLTPEPHFIRRTYPHDGLVAELGGVPENKVCSTPFSVIHIADRFSRPGLRERAKTRKSSSYGIL